MSEGEWREVARLPYDTGIVSCTLCGAMLPQQYWVPASGGARLCGPECARLAARVRALAERHLVAGTPFLSLLRVPEDDGSK